MSKINSSNCSVPTIKSTTAPTTPSRKPTNAPTVSLSPTQSPSTAPTQIPTTSTAVPSRPPTNAPSTTPSRNPTNAPTKNPTRAPTAPTQAPTFVSGICAKTGGAALTPSKSNICIAYRNTSTAFNSFIQSSNKSSKVDYLAKIVRAAFHDAAEVDLTNSTDINGPDGCLSSVADNAGLTESNSILMTTIETQWQQVCDKIGRGDFWVLLATLAIQSAAANPTTGASITIPYDYGRVDKVTCEYGGNSVSRLPDASLTTNIQTVFVGRMNLTVTDTGKQEISSCLR